MTVPSVATVWARKTPSHARLMKLVLPTDASPAKTTLNVRSGGPFGSWASCNESSGEDEREMASSSWRIDEALECLNGASSPGSWCNNSRVISNANDSPNGFTCVGRQRSKVPAETRPFRSRRAVRSLKRFSIGFA